MLVVGKQIAWDLIKRLPLRRSEVQIWLFQCPPTLHTVIWLNALARFTSHSNNFYNRSELYGRNEREKKYLFCLSVGPLGSDSRIHRGGGEDWVFFHIRCRFDHLLPASSDQWKKQQKIWEVFVFHHLHFCRGSFKFDSLMFWNNFASYYYCLETNSECFFEQIFFLISFEKNCFR